VEEFLAGAWQFITSGGAVGSTSIAGLISAYIWKKMNKKMSADKAYTKLEKHYKKDWFNVVEPYIENELNTHRSGLYGVFNRSTLGYEESRQGVNAIKVHRKNIWRKWDFERVRSVFDTETKDAYHWICKQVFKNFEVYYSDVDKCNRYETPEKYNSRLEKDIESIYNTVTRRLDTEIGVHDLIQSSIEGYFTIEDFGHLYKNIIREMKEREDEFLAHLAEFKSNELLSKKQKGKN
jgi:hypothetical protein